jgi:very-short-patch-repair endonuclease
MKKKTTEQYVAEVIDIHGDKYDYSNTVYNGKKNNVIIICKKHGEFTQCANVHLRGSGCKKCATEETHLLQKSDTNTFTEKAKEIYGDKYDYSKSVYVNSKTKVIIICKIHGEFLQTPTDHYHGGCKKCADILRGENRKFSKEEIIQKSREVHGEIYDYSIIEYINGVIENIKCKKHGLFSQLRDIHINRNGGCKKCADILRGENRKYTKEEIIQKAKEVHGDNTYDYSKVIYTGIYNNIIIICKTHGEFLQAPTNHLQGQGCPFCIKKTESKLYEKIQPLYPTIIQQFKQDWCKKIRYLPFDFCIPEYKIIIELDGPQHFQQISNWSSPEEQFENDKYKEQCANDNGYSVIRLLQEDVFYDTYDWVKEVCDAIEEIKNGDEVANVYLCKNGEYDAF